MKKLIMERYKNSMPPRPARFLCVVCGTDFSSRQPKRHQVVCSLSCRKKRNTILNAENRRKAIAEDPEFFQQVRREKKKLAAIRKNAKIQQENK